MTYFTYKNTYENTTEFDFNVDISIKTGEILEVAQESIESLTYIGESLEPISWRIFKETYKNYGKYKK